MLAAYYDTPKDTYYVECGVLALLIVLRLAWLVRQIGWRGILRELRQLRHLV